MMGKKLKMKMPMFTKMYVLSSLPGESDTFLPLLTVSESEQRLPPHEACGGADVDPFAGAGEERDGAGVVSGAVETARSNRNKNNFILPRNSSQIVEAMNLKAVLNRLQGDSGGQLH